MAEQVKLQVELQSNLEKVIDAAKGVKLDKGQSERVEKHTKAAQLALETGDLKTFQRNFNSLVKIFKEAAAETGKLSEEIKKMTGHQASLSQEINKLKDKKASLEGQLTKDGKLKATAAREFAAGHDDAKKVIKADGKVASRDEIIELQRALAEFLAKTGKKITEVTNKDLGNIKTASGATFGSRSSMFAAERYVKAENQHTQSLPTQIQSVQSEIDVKEGEYATLSAEITRMSEAADKGAEDITKLYTEISKLSDATNKIVTDEVNKQRKNGGDQTPASQGAELPTNSMAGLQQQSTGLTKAFKQFTIYNMALKAAKTALKEAVQTVKELDKYLTEQAMVTGKTREETYGLVKSYQDLAMQCGATTKEIAQVATEYMKQGKSTADALVLTEAAVKAAKVARVSVGDSVNYLTTALNGFQLSAEDAMAVSDKFAAVAASSATDYDELAIALSKVASQANLAGMSMDYTTALLTKGLETTREAPETMGTALKTIIARMRELGDYGETLDDGMDINNVESQLKYVGIALRDSNGELRSTEEVLDELGKKWDTLDKNQQAAIAKALAGTRQQARLIAMMEDYERVTELQEISQRSAGATAAQAAVYLEGMEGAMNRVQVAWEKVVMTFTDSEVIIGIVDTFSEIIDYVAALLENPMFTTGVVTLVLMTVIKTIGMKLQEQHIARETAKIENQQALLASKAKENELKATISALKIKRAEFAINKETLKQEIKKTAQLKLQSLEAKKQSILDDPNKSAAQKKQELSLIEDAIKATEEQQKADLEAVDAQDAAFENQIAQANEQLRVQGELTKSLEAHGNTLAQTRNAWAGYLNTVKDCALGIAQYAKSIGTTISNIAKASKTATDAGRPASAAVIPVVGWIISLILEGAALIGTIMTTVQGIISAIQKYQKDTANSADNTADEINKISNEIYKLNERASKLKQVTTAFEEIDSQVIKTKEDIQEMTELLDSAADSLSSEREKTTDSKGREKEVEGAQSQQEVYAGLQTNEERYKYLKTIEEQTQAEADKKREDLLKEATDLRSSNYSEFKKMMDENTSNGKYLQAQSAIRATAYNAMYDYVDTLAKDTDNENLLKQTETLTASLIEGMTALEALDYAEHPEKLNTLVDKIQEAQMKIEDANGAIEEVNATEIFMDEGRSIEERIRAFDAIKESLEGDKVALEAFTKQYSD
jgi:TP901 family phage tail tape measure protein